MIALAKPKKRTAGRIERSAPAAVFPPEQSNRSVNGRGVQPPGVDQIGAALANLTATKQKAMQIAGVKSEAEFKKLPRDEQAAFMAQATGAISPPAGPSEKVIEMDLDRIVRSPLNREEFDPQEMAELVESIKVHGVMVPIIVRKISDDLHEIIMGERRWTGSRTAGRKTIPVIVRNVDERTAEEWRLTENLQRENLKPLDEARGYQRLQEMGYSIEDLVAKLNRSKSSIYSRLAMLKLPEEVTKLVNTGKIDASKAELISRVEDRNLQAKLTAEFSKPIEEYTGGQRIQREMTFREAKALADEATKEIAEEKKWQDKNADHAKKGRKVLSIQASKTVFKYGSLLAGYVRAENKCEYDKQGRKWSALIDLVPMVARDSYTGNAALVFPRKAAQKALKDKGFDFGSKADAQKLAKEAEERKKQDREDEQNRRIAIDAERIGKVVTAAENREPNAEVWRFLALKFAGDGQCDEEKIIKSRKIEVKGTGYDVNTKALKAYIEKADGRTLRGLVIEMQLWEWNGADEEALKQAAAIYGVKVQASGKAGK